MIKTSIEALAKPIGFDIGMSDNVSQAELINGFCEAIYILGDKMDNQLVYIVDKLEPKSLEVIFHLNQFCELKR